jgi:hypothetical protein
VPLRVFILAYETNSLGEGIGAGPMIFNRSKKENKKEKRGKKKTREKEQSVVSEAEETLVTDKIIKNLCNEKSRTSPRLPLQHQARL